MESPMIGEALQRLRAFVVDEALPLWISAGVDPADGTFIERLSFSGTPQFDVPRRAIVQARQIYVFSHAALLGFSPGAREVALNAAHRLIENYHEADGRPGWVFSIHPDGRVCDSRRDFYTHAFVAFGLAWAYKLSPEPVFLESALATLDVLDRQFAASRGGYVGMVSAEPPSRLEQNPHMHLFEAMLAWHEATNQAHFLARAGELYTMMAARFFQPDRHILPEYFDAGWEPQPGVEGRIWEPGHHYEWSWLLHAYAARIGRRQEPIAPALKALADQYGFNEAGLIVDELLDDGTVHKSSTRSWPHTEAIKAEVAAFEAGDVDAPRRAARIIHRLCDVFLGRPVPGGWIDHMEADGSSRVDYMPASTLYHMFLGFAEAHRVWGRS